MIKEILNLKGVEGESRRMYFLGVIAMISMVVSGVVSVYNIKAVSLVILFGVLLILSWVDKRYWDIKYYLIKNG